MAKKKTKKKEVSLFDELKAVAEDLNKVIPLEPPIDLEQSEADLQEEVIEIANEDVAVSDQLSKATWDTLAEIGAGPKAGPEEPEDEEPAKKKAPVEKEVVEEPKAKSEEKSKDAKPPKMGKVEKEKKVPKVKKESIAKYPREHSLIDALKASKTGLDKKDLYEKADALYAKANNRETGKVWTNCFKFILITLEYLELIEAKGNKIIFKG